MPAERTPMVLGFAAWSGTGKTTLLEKLIPLLREQDVRLAVIKASHHDIEIDKPGKDSHRLRQAGAIETLVASPNRWALIHENPEPAEPELAQLLSRLSHDIELVLVEGFRHQRFDKIELHRSVLDKPWLYPDDDSIVAVACDNPDNTAIALPVLDLDDPRQIRDFILKRLHVRP